MARTTREDGDNLLSSSDESEALGKELLIRASQTQKAWRGLTAYSERGSRWKSVKVFTFDKNLPAQEGRLLRHRIQILGGKLVNTPNQARLLIVTPGALSVAEQQRWLELGIMIRYHDWVKQQMEQAEAENRSTSEIEPDNSDSSDSSSASPTKPSKKRKREATENFRPIERYATKKFNQTQHMGKLAEYLATRLPAVSDGRRKGDMVYRDLLRSPLPAHNWASGFTVFQLKSQYISHQALYDRHIREFVRKNPQFLTHELRIRNPKAEGIEEEDMLDDNLPLSPTHNFQDIPTAPRQHKFPPESRRNQRTAKSLPIPVLIFSSPEPELEVEEEATAPVQGALDTSTTPLEPTMSTLAAPDRKGKGRAIERSPTPPPFNDVPPEAGDVTAFALPDPPLQTLADTLRELEKRATAPPRHQSPVIDAPEIERPVPRTRSRTGKGKERARMPTPEPQPELEVDDPASFSPPPPPSPQEPLGPSPRPEPRAITPRALDEGLPAETPGSVVGWTQISSPTKERIVRGIPSARESLSMAVPRVSLAQSFLSAIQDNARLAPVVNLRKKRGRDLANGEGMARRLRSRTVQKREPEPEPAEVPFESSVDPDTEIDIEDVTPRAAVRPTARRAGLRSARVPLSSSASQADDTPIARRATQSSRSTTNRSRLPGSRSVGFEDELPTPEPAIPNVLPHPRRSALITPRTSIRGAQQVPDTGSSSVRPRSTSRSPYSYSARPSPRESLQSRSRRASVASAVGSPDVASQRLAQGIPPEIAELLFQRAREQGFSEPEVINIYLRKREMLEDTLREMRKIMEAREFLEEPSQLEEEDEIVDEEEEGSREFVGDGGEDYEAEQGLDGEAEEEDESEEDLPVPRPGTAAQRYRDTQRRLSLASP